MLPSSNAHDRVREWQRRKACSAPDPLFGPDGETIDGELTGAVVASATLAGKVVASTGNAITTNAGARVWFPVQHVNRSLLAPSTKRWR